MVMEAVAVRRLTLSEFLARPETEPASELIDGEVVQKPVPRIEHNFPVGNLYLWLFAHPATSAGIALTEQGLPYPGSEMGNLRVPDLVFFAAGREFPDEGYPSEPPGPCRRGALSRSDPAQSPAEARVPQASGHGLHLACRSSAQSGRGPRRPASLHGARRR